MEGSFPAFRGIFASTATSRPDPSAPGDACG